MEKEPLRYVEAPVYVSNIYKLSDGNEYTICEHCGEVNEVSESDGYCTSCEEPLGDAHGDLIDPENIEKLMFSYMETINDRIIKLDQMVKDLLLGKDIDLIEYIKSAKHHIGFGHTVFTKDNGCLISSYLKREEIEINNEKVEKVAWMQGTKVSPEIFEKIQSGECKGYSFGAKGNRVKLNTGSN